MRTLMSNGLCLCGEMESELTEIIIDQWSSTEHDFASQGHVAMSGDGFDCHKVRNVLSASSV